MRFGGTEFIFGDDVVPSSVFFRDAPNDQRHTFVILKEEFVLSSVTALDQLLAFRPVWQSGIKRSVVYASRKKLLCTTQEHVAPGRRAPQRVSTHQTIRGFGHPVILSSSMADAPSLTSTSSMFASIVGAAGSR